MQMQNEELPWFLNKFSQNLEKEKMYNFVRKRS